jgi:predicted metal-dependent peptidase
MLDLAQATDPEAVAKFRRAVVDLLMRTPLFGFTMLGTAIRVKEDPKINTMCTDGRSIWYSPRWVREKPLPSVLFGALHETVHVFGNHPARCGDRDPRRWNYAADVRTNHDCIAILESKGLQWKLEEGLVPAHEWAKWLTVEEIYDRLPQSDGVPPDYEPDMLPPPPATEGEDKEFKRQLTEDLTQATFAEEQRSKGKTIEDLYGSSVWERLKELRRCDVPWHVLLQGRLAAALGQDLATWIPPNRKWFPEIALPSRKGSMENELLLGIDVSGSITNEDLKRFRACIMPAARRARTTTVVTFDERVRECKSSTRPETLMRDLRFATGSHSHTDVRGVFEEVDKRRPSAVAIITDGYIVLPERKYPQTHWILTPSGKALPWGHIYKLHFSW